MSLLRSLIPQVRSIRPRASAGQPLPFDEWASYFNFSQFPLFMSQTLGGREEEIADSFAGLVQGALRSNGVVFACELVRMMLFAEARFQFRQLRSGRPGDLFGNPDLRLLEQPWPKGTTGDLLTRAMQHADFGGTAFVVRRSATRLAQPRPDWVTIVLGSHSDPDMDAADLDAEFLGILYHPGGKSSDRPVVPVLASDVAVFAPIPDPIASVRGIPWTSVVTRNIRGHNAATTHKLKFFENGATPQMIVSLDKDAVKDPVKFRQWLEVIEQDHAGVTNAYKTLYLGAGAQATVVGANLAQLDLKATQGADETIIAAAAGVGPVVAQLSEGLQGSSLNSGNFREAMRRVADLTMRPLWRNMAGSLAAIIDVPRDAELWYDDRDIPSLKDDVRDAAEVRAKDAQAIRNLADTGFEPDAVIDAVVAGDLKRLRGKHTGLYSVQLQKPGGPTPPPPPAATAERVEVPLLASGEPVEVRCTGTHKDGRPCNALLGKRATEAPVGFETKCHQCGTLVAA